MNIRRPRTLILETLSVGVSPEFRAAVREAARDRGTTIARFVRGALAEEIRTGGESGPVGDTAESSAGGVGESGMSGSGMGGDDSDGPGW
jgi:hypothetical protein